MSRAIKKAAVRQMVRQMTGPMTAKKTGLALKAFIKESKEIMARIAKDRDRLRWLVDDAESIIESCDGAEQEIASALDKLSQYL